MKNALLQMVLFFLPFQMLAQKLHSPLRDYYTGVGTYSKTHCDVFSFTNNQAALTSIKSKTAGLYAEHKFFLKEMGLYTTAIAFPIRNGGIGVQLNYFGYSEYNESQAGIAYGKKLGKLVDLGVQFDYYHLQVAGYGSAGTIGFQIGSIFNLSDVFRVGMHVYNPAGSRFGKSSTEKLASIYTMGFGYDLTKEVFISIAISKEENRPVHINAGLHYQFAESFFARLGILTDTGSPYIGVGLLWNIFRFDVAVNYHPQLGISPAMLLAIDLDRKE